MATPTKLMSLLTPDYVPGLLVTAHSLAYRGKVSGLDWGLMTESGELPDEAEKIREYGFNPIPMKMEAVAADVWPTELPPTKYPRIDICYNRLRWLTMEPEHHIWIDLDLLCMKDAREMLEWPSITSASEAYFEVRGVPMMAKDSIWVGLVRLDPSIELYNACLKKMKEMDLATLAEQTVISRTVEELGWAVNRVGPEWAMFHRNILKNYELWKPEDAFFIHYTDVPNPWEECTNWKLEPAIKLWKDYYAENIL